MSAERGLIPTSIPGLTRQRVYIVSGHGSDCINTALGADVAKDIVPPECGYVTFVQCGRVNFTDSYGRLMHLLQRAEAASLLSYPDYPPFSTLLRDLFSPWDSDMIMVRRPYEYYTNNSNSFLADFDAIDPHTGALTDKKFYAKSGLFMLPYNVGDPVMPPIDARFADPGNAQYGTNATKPYRNSEITLFPEVYVSIQDGSLTPRRPFENILHQGDWRNVEMKRLLEDMTPNGHNGDGNRLYPSGLLWEFACRYISSSCPIGPIVPFYRANSMTHESVRTGKPYRNIVQEGTNAAARNNKYIAEAPKNSKGSVQQRYRDPSTASSRDTSNRDWSLALADRIVEGTREFNMADLVAFYTKQQHEISFRRNIMVIWKHFYGVPPKSQEFRRIAGCTPVQRTMGDVFHYNYFILREPHGEQQQIDQQRANLATIESIEECIRTYHEAARRRASENGTEDAQYDDSYDVEVPNAGKPATRCTVVLNKASVNQWLCDGHLKNGWVCPSHGTNTTFEFRYQFEGFDLCLPCAKHFKTTVAPPIQLAPSQLPNQLNAPPLTRLRNAPNTYPSIQQIIEALVKKRREDASPSKFNETEFIVKQFKNKAQTLKKSLTVQMNVTEFDQLLDDPNTGDFVREYLEIVHKPTNGVAQAAQAANGARMANANHGARVANVNHGARMANVNHGARVANVNHGARMANVNHGAANVNHGARMANVNHGTTQSANANHGVANNAVRPAKRVLRTAKRVMLIKPANHGARMENANNGAANEAARSVNEAMLIKSANHGARVENEAARPANEAARPAKRAARTAKRAAQPANEAAQPANEAVRPAKRAARMANKAARPANEAAQMANEAAQMANEAAQPENEAARLANEAARLAFVTKLIANANHGARVVNRIGHPMRQGSKDKIWYCGQKMAEPIPGTDSVCGPDDGPQCADCEATSRELELPMLKFNRAGISMHPGDDGNMYCRRQGNAPNGSVIQCGTYNAAYKIIIRCSDCQNTVISNEVGAPMHLGSHDKIWYCGQMKPIPRTNGFCGPGDGPSCADCETTSRIFGLPMLEFNDVGVSMHLGTNGIMYCRRWLGEAAIPGSNGQCGPDNGPQCADCAESTRSETWQNFNNNAPMASGPLQIEVPPFNRGDYVKLKQKHDPYPVDQIWVILHIYPDGIHVRIGIPGGGFMINKSITELERYVGGGKKRYTRKRRHNKKKTIKHRRFH